MGSEPFDFGHGFVAAGLSAIAGAAIKGAELTAGKEFLAKVIVGGTISEVTGGKFANGAAGAVFAMVVQSVGARLSTSNGEAGGPNNKFTSNASDEAADLVVGKLDHQPLKDADLTDANPAVGQGCGQYKCRTGGRHAGVDIHAEIGTEIGAAGDGVASVGYLKGYGRTVLIDHGDGVTTRYAHLKGYNVTEGQLVESGTIIGVTGISGNVPKGADPHLHFEIMLKGEHINPSSIFTWGNQ